MSQARTSSLLLALVLITPALSGQDDCGGSDDSCPSCVADIALYDPGYENDGVWEEEVQALITLFNTYNYSYEIIDHQDINAGRLGEGDAQRYRALVAPGGYAYWRNRAVSATGEAAIRGFVSGGGGYVGFCAGTFWTAETVVWAEESTGGGGAYNSPSDYAAYPYDLGLLKGQATGPFGWKPWEGGYAASLEPAAMDTSIPTLALLGMPAKTRFFYYGGPVFSFDEIPVGLEIWGRAIAPAGLPEDAKTGAGEPSIVRFREGEGEVVLFSYHPEILMGSEVDGLTMSDPLAEEQVEVDTGEQTLDEINYQSWNIVNGALSLATGRPVAPIAPFSK